MSPQAPTAARLSSPETPHIEGLKSLAGDEKQTFVQSAANGGNEPLLLDTAARTNVGFLMSCP